MTPNFEIFRKLYARIAAKPEALVRLDKFRSRSGDCGTPFCVLGELLEMPESQALGFAWFADVDWDFIPSFNGNQGDGHYGIGSKGAAAIGIDPRQATRLFTVRERHDISEKQEALERIEALFAAHNEPLHLCDKLVTQETPETVTA